MTFTISSEDPRSIKAIAIAAGASQWLKCKSADGQKAYGIPSQCQPGRFYLVTSATCDCPDFQRHGLSGVRIGRAGDHVPCKHVLGVRLHLELVKAQQPKAKHTRPVLDMIRMPDGSIRWEAHNHADGSTTYLPRHDTAPLECGCILRNSDGACSHQTQPLPPLTDAQAARIFGRL